VRNAVMGKELSTSDEWWAASIGMGIVGCTPGSFRKSGKHGTYRIRNLEMCTENGRSSRWSCWGG